MDTHFPKYNVLYQVTLAPTNVYAGLMALAVELSGLSAQTLPANSVAEMGNSALEFSRRAKGTPQELIQEAEIAMRAGGAVIRLQAKNPGQFDVFHSYCEELLSIIPPDCPDEGLDLQ